MTNEEKVREVLSDHERRIALLEKALGTPPGRKPPMAGEKTLSDRILELRANKFFSKKKTAPDVYKEIQKSYDCDQVRVDVALFRLAKSGALRTTRAEVSGKKYKAYAW